MRRAQLMADTNEALKEAGLQYKPGAEIRHMVEVLIEDLGYEELGKPVVKPLDGIKVAGYVGCQTNRPFGIAGESFENPMYLDKLIETVGGEATRQVRAEGDLLRRLARVLRAGEKRKSRSRTSSSRRTTTAPT